MYKPCYNLFEGVTERDVYACKRWCWVWGLGHGRWGLGLQPISCVLENKQQWA